MADYSPQEWADEIIDDVADGYYDDQLRQLEAAIRDRIANRAYEQVQNMKRGTRVRLVNIRPKYMVNQTGTVTGWARSKVMVALDHPEAARRYAFNGEVKVPMTCLEIMPAERKQPARKPAKRTAKPARKATTRKARR